MENLNVDNDVDSTSGTTTKVSKKNVANSLIHRVICLYFIESLKKKKQYKFGTFILNNPEIATSLPKFVNSDAVIKGLNNLRTKNGEDFLDRDTRVVWVKDRSLISLSNIPDEVLRDYSTEPKRLRGQRTIRTAKDGPLEKVIISYISLNIFACIYARERSVGIRLCSPV